MFSHISYVSDTYITTHSLIHSLPPSTRHIPAGPSGVVYAVEFSHRPGRDLINMAKLRTNVIPIVEVST